MFLLTPFSPFTAKIVTDRETGKARGFGFVTLLSADDVHKALAYNENGEDKVTS